MSDYIPTESVEQQCLFNWAKLREARYPELALMFHIPNGGKRNIAEATRFKAEGVKAGVPDICLPVPRDTYHGLWIELKRTKHGTVSEHQKKWLKELNTQGYCAVVCHGWVEVSKVIISCKIVFFHKRTDLKGLIEAWNRRADATT